METDVLVACFRWRPYTVHSKVVGAQLALDVWAALLQNALLAPELHFLTCPFIPASLPHLWAAPWWGEGGHTGPPP